MLLGVRGIQVEVHNLRNSCSIMGQRAGMRSRYMASKYELLERPLAEVTANPRMSATSWSCGAFEVASCLRKSCDGSCDFHRSDVIVSCTCFSSKQRHSTIGIDATYEADMGDGLAKALLDELGEHLGEVRCPLAR